MPEIDGLGLLGQHRDFTARVVIALLEGLEGGRCAAFEAELRAELRPVDLEGCAALLGGVVLAPIGIWVM